MVTQCIIHSNESLTVLSNQHFVAASMDFNLQSSGLLIASLPPSHYLSVLYFFLLPLFPT